MGKRVEISQESLCDLYTNRRLSFVEVGKRLDCSSTTVGTYLRKLGIPVRDISKANKGRVPWNKRDDISEDELYNLYITKKLSIPKIGEVFGCSGTIIWNRLREFGMPRRARGCQKGCASSKKGLTYEEIYGRERAEKIQEKMKHLTKEQIKARLRRRIPSSLEEQFQKIVDKHNLPYKYVGNGAFILGSYNPDFINTNSEKIAVEVYARYYKLRRPESIKEWKEERTQVFQGYGWKILYFDETEVTEENVLKTLRPLRPQEIER